MGRTFRALLIITSIWGLVVAGVVGGAEAIAAQNQDGGRLTVFAAASTKAVMDKVKAMAKTKGIDATMVYAGSSLLARQIENGSPADVFISAHPMWIERLNNKSVLHPESIVSIASNELVLIANKKIFAKKQITNDAKATNDTNPGDIITKHLKSDYLAVADPDHVPAGIYAKEALTSIGLWDGVKNKLARTMDVTAALALVSSGEAPLGIVYASDVVANKTLGGAVSVVSVFNSDSHAPIIYSAGAIKRDDSVKNGAATQFIDILKSSAAMDVFMDFGFSKPSQTN